MKPYFAVIFLAIFMHIYVANAGCTSTADNCVVTADGCNQISGETILSVDEYALCDNTSGNKTWYHCKKNDEDTLECIQKPTTNPTPCEKGFIFRNDKCLSCADLINEDHATTEKEGTATSMSSCILPSDKENNEGDKEKIQYIDEKGTYTYASSCSVQCTEETAHLCTNTSA